MSDISSPMARPIDPRKIELYRSSPTAAASPHVTTCVPAVASHTATSALALDDAKPLDPESFPNPPRFNRGQLPSTIPNVKHLLNEYGVTVRYDVIKKKTCIRLPHHSGTSDNADNVALTQILSLATLNGMSTGPIPAIVEVIGDNNQYNRVADWIIGKEWDGIDRLDALCETLVHREDFPSPLKQQLLHKWLISAVAAALKPNGFYSRGILTLQGPQSIGKTSWIRCLVPDPELREDAVKLDHHLDGSNKDSLLTAVSHWIVEIGELDSSLKKDVARLKGFITSDRDKIRRPYARSDSEFQRRTVFCASVNDHAFLVDATGNTRFWTIPVTRIDHTHRIDMQQLFAQIAVDYHNGESWWLTSHEEALLERCNRHHRTVSVIRELIVERVDMDRATQPSLPAMSSIELLSAIGIDRATNPQCKECASILRELFGDPKKINGIYKWRIPLKSHSFSPELGHSKSSNPVTDEDLY